ncbi:MAG: hypothetical protein JW885_13965 [Deltaproteobacteria bacterium]|nr:hypothetical protein [Candidatus Zymogenaceae bacterium]
MEAASFPLTDVTIGLKRKFTVTCHAHKGWYVLITGKDIFSARMQGKPHSGLRFSDSRRMRP